MHSNRLVVGTIPTINMDTNHQTVKVRYTTDEWQTYYDTEAVPVERRSDENLFVFEVNMEGKSSLDFVICLHISNIDELEYWDNNRTKNYSLVLR